MSTKLIKDCSECTKEVNGYSSKCQEWEVKKKEALEKIKQELCLDGITEKRDQLGNPDPEGHILYNHGHRGSIKKALEKYKTIKDTAGWETTRACAGCKKQYTRNEYGDETGELSFANEDWRNHDCQQQSTQTQQSQSSQNKSISNNTQFTNTERERERERERESNSKSNLPWILGGIAGLGLIGVVVYFLTRKKGREK